MLRIKRLIPLISADINVLVVDTVEFIFDSEKHGDDGKQTHRPTFVVTSLKQEHDESEQLFVAQIAKCQT